MNARPISTGSLVSSTNTGYAASVEGTAGQALAPPSSRPPGALACPSSARSSLSEGSDSAGRMERLRRVSLMDYKIPKMHPLAATGPPSVDTGYAASAGGVVDGASSAGNSPRSSGGLQPNSNVARSVDLTPNARGTAPNAGGVTPNNGGVIPNSGGLTLNAGGVTPNSGGMTPNRDGVSPDNSDHCPDALLALVDVAYKTSSESSASSRIPPRLEAPSSLGNRSRSENKSSVRRAAYPMESISDAASRHSGAPCSPRLKGNVSSAYDENDPALTVARLPAWLAVSTESSRHPSAPSDGSPDPTETGLLLRPTPGSSSPSNQLEWDPGNTSCLESKRGNHRVDPAISVSPLPRSEGASMSLGSWRTSRLPQLDDRATERQASPCCGSRSSGRRNSLLLASLTTSSASQQKRHTDKGREFTSKKAFSDELSLDERSPFSGSSVAGPSLATGRLEQVRRSLPLSETALLLVEEFDSGRVSSKIKPPRLTSLTLSILGGFTYRPFLAGVGSTGSPDSVDTDRFSEALLSATSSTFSRYARSESGESSASVGLRSPGGGYYSTSRRTSFCLSVSATPWRSLVEHDESPSAAGSFSPSGSKIIYASHGKAADKPTRLVKETPLPDEVQAMPTIRLARSTTGNEEDNPRCADAMRSPVLGKSITDVVSALREDSPSPATIDDGPAESTIESDKGKDPRVDEVRSPVLEKDTTDMVSALPEDLPSPVTADDGPAEPTIGRDDGKGRCLDAVRSWVLEKEFPHMVSTLRDDLPSPGTADDELSGFTIGIAEGKGRCSDPVPSSFLEQDITNMMSTLREDQPSPATNDDGPADATIGSNDGKGRRLDAVRLPVLEQEIANMMSTLRGDFPTPATADDGSVDSTTVSDEGKGRCPDPVLSPVVEKDITDMISTSREELPSPATSDDDDTVESTIGSGKGKGRRLDAVRSPVLEKDITDMVPTLRDDFPSPATADDDLAGLSIGSDEGKGRYLDSFLSPVLEKDVTDVVPILREYIPSPATADNGPAESTIGSDDGKGRRLDAVRSQVLGQEITDMVSTLREDFHSPATADDELARPTTGCDEDKRRCPDPLISPVLEQNITETASVSRTEFNFVLEQRKIDMMPKSHEALPSPAAEHRQIEREGSNLCLAAPSPSLELHATDDGALTSRSDEPSPEDPLASYCSGVVTAGNNNSGIKNEGVLPLLSFPAAAVADNAVSASPRVLSREEGDRGLRFGDSPSVSQRGSSDSTWSLTRYVASGRAGDVHDGSDSSWSLTKGIASGEIDVSAGKTRNPGSPISELSFRMTLEHGPQPSTESSVEPSGDSDTNSAPAPAAHYTDSATAGRDNRINPVSSVLSALNYGSSDGRSSAHSQDADERRRAGRVARTSPSLGSTVSEPARGVLHFTTRANASISRETTSCARLHSRYPPSESERHGTPHQERSSSTRCSPAQPACSEVSMRQRSSPNPSTRRKPSSSSGGDGFGSTQQATNILPSTVVSRQKITTSVSRAPRGRIEREAYSFQRSSSTPSARTSARDTGPNHGKHRGKGLRAVCSSGVEGLPPKTKAKSSSTPQNRTPPMAAATVRTSSNSSSISQNSAPILASAPVGSSQSHVSSATSSSTSSGRLRVSGQHGGESTKYTPTLRASPLTFDVVSSTHRSTQRSNYISAKNGTAARPSQSRRSPRASRSASLSASKVEPRTREITKSTSIPRRSSIEVKTTKTSRSRSLAIQSRFSTSGSPRVPRGHSRVRAHRSSCRSPSSAAVNKLSGEEDRPRTSTNQSRTVAPSQRLPWGASWTPVVLSSACASSAGSVAAVSPETERTSISGCSGGVNGGSQGEEDNAPHFSARDGSATASESRGVCGADVTCITSTPARRPPRTSDESAHQEGSFCGDSECGSGENTSGGEECADKHGLADIANSNDASGGLSSISSDHRDSSIEPVGDLVEAFSGGASSGQILWVGCALMCLKIRQSFKF